MNKNIIIQGILAVAIVVLFVLHFLPASNSESTPESSSAQTVDLSQVQMAYVNIDTLVQGYQMYIDLSGELKGKMDKREAELKNKAQKHQSDIADFQNKAQKGLETRATLEAMSTQLSQNEQALVQLQNQYSQELGEEEVVNNRKVLNDVMEYLKEYNKNKNLQFIFSNSFGGALLLANPALDITQDVLKGLNVRYASVQNNKK